ncbi:MAG: hypothetical protein JWP01_2028 [Myxococcales bacterium]|nr:hypothetical protein [Myxococcales bacterium]
MVRVSCLVLFAACAASGPAPVTPVELTEEPSESLPITLGGGMPSGEDALREARDIWPSGPATFETWWRIAVLANRARPLPSSDELTVEALDQALQVSGCDPDNLGWIRLLATAVRGADGHPTALDPTLDRLSDVGPTECRAARSD